MVALIEIGNGYLGDLPIQKTKATIYYYDEDITAAELQQEIRDLKEFYSQVRIVPNYPEKFQEVIKNEIGS